MHIYQFHIAGLRPFHDREGMELPDAETAWAEALRLVRDIEGSLQPGESWSLDVVEDGTTIFRISLATEDLRIRRGSGPATTMTRSKTL
ncbi:MULTISPECIES: tRNA 5-methylaminomethyl-2-thiouridine synthase [unclassified Bradyrhizobium]|uniref:DUF6894 family protein n=1 Tax=unclassified Bradyrhizobium TaxID=2631580 RepID=UPI00102E347F|nr:MULTISPECIES: tRNA 5-methylaminomethyl-2-thiouridine synthase [unclassified Bradyrhizobium]MDI4238053.1 tRNA 5-methylaminomethyl-2-thiouridine synthase [Bradyrhizobium sp. Arg237L]TAI64057.1 tRNA 5-methylaminomethyl-2-thiouridine synthase [Bradyrhizobium sp. Leo170]